MKRVATIVLFVIGSASSVACNKPSEESCRQAVINMRKLLGTEQDMADLMPAIRSCRGGSTKEAVECAIKAKTREELGACKFAHFDEQTGSGSSGSGSAGSSDPGK